MQNNPNIKSKKCPIGLFYEAKWGIFQANIIDYQSQNAPFRFFINMGHFKNEAKQMIKERKLSP